MNDIISLLVPNYLSNQLTLIFAGGSLGTPAAENKFSAMVRGSAFTVSFNQDGTLKIMVLAKKNWTSAGNLSSVQGSDLLEFANNHRKDILTPLQNFLENGGSELEVPEKPLSSPEH